MTDTLSRVQRSDRMRRVRQHGTALELAVRKGLHKRGLRYRIGDKELPGRPDIVFPAYKVALFVHGCFWHGHSCRLGRLPTTNIEFWKGKIDANRERDARKQTELETLHWRVLTVWQCQISRADARETVFDEIAAMIRKSDRVQRPRSRERGNSSKRGVHW